MRTFIRWQRSSRRSMGRIIFPPTSVLTVIGSVSNPAKMLRPIFHKAIVGKQRLAKLAGAYQDGVLGVVVAQKALQLVDKVLADHSPPLACPSC